MLNIRETFRLVQQKILLFARASSFLRLDNNTGNRNENRAGAVVERGHLEQVQGRL